MAGDLVQLHASPAPAGEPICVLMFSAEVQKGGKPNHASTLKTPACVLFAGVPLAKASVWAQSQRRRSARFLGEGCGDREGGMN